MWKIKKIWFMIKRRNSQKKQTDHLWSRFLNYQTGNFKITVIEMLTDLVGRQKTCVKRQEISRDMETITESNGNAGEKIQYYK